MISQKQISQITEKITRRFEIELPLQIADYNIENDKLYISFYKSEISRTFELTKGVIIEFDTDSRIIGLNIDSVSDFLPRTSNDEITEV